MQIDTRINEQHGLIKNWKHISDTPLAFQDTLGKLIMKIDLLELSIRRTPGLFISSLQYDLGLLVWFTI